MWTTVQFRLISSVLLFGGLFFIVVGGGLAYLFIAVPHNGGEALQLLLLALSGVLLSLGLSVFAAGFWQVVFGKANIVIIKALLYLMCAFFVIVVLGRLIIRIFE